MYDSKCEELARYFLTDEKHEPEEVISLAQEIQNSIERWYELRGDRFLLLPDGSIPAKHREALVHGFNCEKKPHVRTGYLHGEDDDTPYMVDGLKYCGRCHTSL